jgi:hypothetical protein
MFDFQGFDAKSKCCAHCGVLRAMEAGLVHEDEMMDEGGCHPGLHLGVMFCAATRIMLNGLRH